MGPSFSNAKTVSSGTTVHRDLTHVARSRGHGAEARVRPTSALNVSVSSQCHQHFSRNKTNITNNNNKQTKKTIIRLLNSRLKVRGSTWSRGGGANHGQPTGVSLWVNGRRTRRGARESVGLG